MFKRIGAFFTTPVFANDEDLTRVASLLNIVLNIVTFALPLIVIKGLLSAYPAERYIVIILALVLAQGLRWLMWNRKAKLSGFLLAVMATSGTTAVLYYAGTVRANALPFYMIAIVFAGLLAGNRAAIATALLSSVSVLGLNLAENAGSLPQADPTRGIESWITLTILFLLMAVFLNLATRAIVEALTRARQELSKRLQAEQALTYGERRFRALTENISDVVALLDATGNYVYVSSSDQSVTGYSAAELIGTHYLDLVHPDDRERIYAVLERSLNQSGIPAPFIFRFTHKDGSTRWIEGSSVNLTNDPAVQGVIINYRDITDRKQAEKALRNSEARYRILFEQANDAIFVERIGTDEIVDANQQACELMGYTRQELLSMTVPDLQAPEVRGQARRVIENELTQHEGRPFETLSVHRDGRRIAVEVTTSQMTGADSDLALSIVRDITERKHTEALVPVRLRLFEFATRYSLKELLQKTLDEVGILTNSPIGFYHFVEADQKTLSLQAWSTRTLAEFCKAEGRGLHYNIDQAGVWVDCVSERRPVIHNDYATLAHRKGLPEGHAEVVRELVVPIIRDDRIVAILGVGNKPQDYNETDIDTIAYFADIAWEIVAHKRAEEALRESEARYRAIFEQAAIGVAQVVSSTGHYVQVNQKHCDIVGYTREELLQKTFHEITYPDDLQSDLDNMQLLLEGQIRSFTMEKRYIHKDGSIVWVNLTVSPMWLVSEEPKYHIAVVEDITDRKPIEAEREQLITELGTKNAELERFTYTVSHDLKSPLITIGGFLGFIEKDAKAGDIDQLQADMAHVRSATNTMQRLLDELLELSRIGRLMNSPQEVPFEVVAQDAIELVGGQLANRGAEVVIAPGLPNVIGDRARLVEVMQNLVDNAVKFMGDQPSPRIEIGMREQDGEHVFYVQDNGAGIASRYHDKVFGLFEKLDAASEGTGVGLALVKRVIEVHGGRIWIESEGQGHGTTVCFTLKGKPTGDIQ